MMQGVPHGGRRGLTALLLAAVVALTGCAATPTSSPTAGPHSASTAAPAAPPSASPAPASDAASASASQDTGPAASSDDPAPTGSTSAESSPAAAAAGPLTLPDALPVSLSVPAIGVTSPLSSLGRNADGTVEVPSLDDPDAGAGWFRDSPEPGSLGPAIILGHVDSRQYGPGVFYDLKNLSAGDDIEITRADGTVAVFTVDSVQDVPKDRFPTQQVYGNLDHAGLRLITCGGVFDSETRSYEDNIIAFASLTSSRAA